MINQGSFDLNTDEPNPSPHRQSLVKRLFIYRYRYTIERSSRLANQKKGITTQTHDGFQLGTVAIYEDLGQGRSSRWGHPALGYVGRFLESAHSSPVFQLLFIGCCRSACL
ncbi:hypothetical protein [Coleofasciculus sp. G2-EDA-02]|uniref:hypothetical protein n=1 Tax=Coleofasciculus sp. G2-EDA-02 TaxID=3069529 RepID=UPI0032F69E45